MRRSWLFLLCLPPLILAAYLGARAWGLFLDRPVRARPASPALWAERGAPDYVPGGERLEFTLSGVWENTLPAFDRAVARGLGTLHLDLRLTADQQLLVYHDARLERLTRGEGPLAAHSLEVLQTLRVGESVPPSLEQVLSQFRQRVGYVLELRDTEPTSVAPFKLVELLRRHTLLDRAVVVSRAPWLLAQVESLEPGLMTLLTVGPFAAQTVADQLLPTAVETRWVDFYGLDGVAAPLETLAATQVEALRARGLFVAVSGVVDATGLEKARGLGVDAVLTYFTTLESLPPKIPPHKVDMVPTLNEPLSPELMKEAIQAADEAAAKEAAAVVGAGSGTTAGNVAGEGPATPAP